MKPDAPHSFVPRNPTENKPMPTSKPWINITRSAPEARTLREAALNLAAVHAKPVLDSSDSAAGLAWSRLAEAAVHYAALAGTRSKK